MTIATENGPRVRNPGRIRPVTNTNQGALERFERRMAHYYVKDAYHLEWTKGINVRWQPGWHAHLPGSAS
jgi:hypothetical protein